MAGAPKAGATTGAQGQTAQIRQTREWSKAALAEVLRSLGLPEEVSKLQGEVKKQAQRALKEFEAAGGKPNDEALSQTQANLRMARRADGMAGLPPALQKTPTGKAGRLPKVESFVKQDNGAYKLVGLPASHPVMKLASHHGIDTSKLDENTAGVLNDILLRDAGGQISDANWKQIGQELNSIVAKKSPQSVQGAYVNRGKAEPTEPDPLAKYGDRLADLAKLTTDKNTKGGLQDAAVLWKAGQHQKSLAILDQVAQSISKDPTVSSGLAEGLQTLKELLGAAAVTQAASVKEAEPAKKPTEQPKVRQGEARAPTATRTGSRFGPISVLANNLASFNGTKKSDDALEKKADEICTLFAKELGIENPGADEKKAVRAVLNRIAKDVPEEEGPARYTGIMRAAYGALAAEELKANGRTGAHASLATLSEMMHKEVVQREADRKAKGLPPEEGLAKAFEKMAGDGVAYMVAGALGKSSVVLDDELVGRMTNILHNISGQEHVKKAALNTDIKLRPEAATAREFRRQLRAQASKDVRDLPPSKDPRKRAEDTLLQLKAQFPNLAKLDLHSEKGQRALEALEAIFAKGGSDGEVYANALAVIEGHLGFPSPVRLRGQMAHQMGSSELGMTALERNLLLSQVVEMATDPEGFRQRQLAHAQGVRQETGFDPTQLNVNNFGIPSLTGDGNPRDMDGKKAQLYAQRSMVLTSILHDPCLSIEDKIFLFMMWFAAFADKEREFKMEEIAELDRQESEQRQRMQQAKAERGKAEQTLGASQATLKSAEKDLAEAKESGNWQKAKQAEDRIAKAKEGIESAEVQMKEAGIAYEQLKAQTDRAPKSREILLFELDRITQLRGNVMDMARHFLEDSHRRIKEIMR